MQAQSQEFLATKPLKWMVLLLGLKNSVGFLDSVISGIALGNPNHTWGPQSYTRDAGIVSKQYDTRIMYPENT